MAICRTWWSPAGRSTPGARNGSPVGIATNRVSPSPLPFLIRVIGSFANDRSRSRESFGLAARVVPYCVALVGAGMVHLSWCTVVVGLYAHLRRDEVRDAAAGGELKVVAEMPFSSLSG